MTTAPGFGTAVTGARWPVWTRRFILYDVKDEPRERSEARRPVFRTISGRVPSYQTGAGCGTVFWVVIAIPLLIVALATSEILSASSGVSQPSWDYAVINLVFVVTGHGEGGWTYTDVRPKGPDSSS